MTASPEQQVVINLSSEELAISKRVLETGRVAIHVETSASTAVVSDDLMSETVEVERRPVGLFVDVVPQVREEGDVLIWPIVEERFVKRLFLREELRICRRRETKAFTATAELRREDAVIERINLSEAGVSPASETPATFPPIRPEDTQ